MRPGGRRGERVKASKPIPSNPASPKERKDETRINELAALQDRRVKRVKLLHRKKRRRE